MSYANRYNDPRQPAPTSPWENGYVPSWKDFKVDQHNIEEAERRGDFIHRLSYNKAVGYISRRDQIPLYNGSSYNRKPPRPQPVDPWEVAYALASEEEKERMEIERDYDHYLANKGVNFYQFDYKGSRLTGYEMIEPKKPREKGHTLSKRSKDKVRDKMLALYRACSGRDGFRSNVVNFTFCTLTFIAPVEDNQAMDILNVWFGTIKKRYGKFNYISVAERQHNGNIHFHIIADCRFPIGYINSLWVKNQVEHGVINKDAVRRLKEEYNTTFSNLHTEGKYHIVHEFLNPVDIKPVKTIDGISSYLTNYVTKNEGVFDCAAWSCSDKVSKMFTCKIIDKKLFDKTGVAKLNQITSKPRNVIIEGRTVYKPPRTYINETYYGEYCTINTIYNKSRFQHCLNDLEAINKIILSATKKIDPAEIRELITIDRQEYHWEFGPDLKKIFRIKPKEIKAIAEIQEPPAEKIQYPVDQFNISDNSRTWQPVAAWDLD